MNQPTRRVAIVTGADINLGREMALALCSAGIRVVFTSLREAAVRGVIDEAGLGADRALGVGADLSHPQERQRLVAAAIDAFGQVDILVNNAALTPETLWPDWLVTGEPKPWEIDDALYRRFLEIDTVAPHSLMCAVVPGMLRRGWGRIINVTTSLSTMLAFWPYGSAKAALEAQTAVLAKRLAGSGITANVLVPGGFTKPGPIHLPGGQVIQPQLRPQIMVAPIRWLASADSDAVSGRRILASRWDANRPGLEALAAASFEVGWPLEQQRAIEPTVSGEAS